MATGNKSYTSIFCVILFTLFYSFSQAQIHQPVYRELIVELPVLSTEKNLSATIFGLIGMGGIKYEGYCEQMKCLLLKADENVHPDNTAIMVKLKDLTTAFFIKPSGKISQVLESCKDPVVVNPEPVTTHYTD